MVKNKQHQLSYWRSRIQAMENLGGVFCVSCGIGDIRVLTFNHILGNREKEQSMRYMTQLSKGNRLSEFEVRCYNCNMLYEYERGHRELPECFYRLAQ